MTQQTEQTTTVRCAIYTRTAMSEPKAIEAQRRSVDTYITGRERDGWFSLPERYDDCGYAGTDTDRPAVQRLLTDSENGDVDCVVIQSVDRLSRSVRDLAEILKTLHEHGTTVVFVDSGHCFQGRKGGAR